MLSALRQVPGAGHLQHAAREVHQAIREIAGGVAWPRRRVSTYLSDGAVRKLHIGCGQNLLGGWLNSDCCPESPDVIRLDASRRFPFEDESFDYVFSEHMIEHIPYAEGLRMLQQCHRVLRKNGRIRVSTPDLRFLISLYCDGKSDLQQRYIRWASDAFIGNGEYTDTMVINNFMRAWGHLFIYDEKTLTRSLELCGFVDVVGRRINESQDESLRDLENEQRMPADFLQLETFTLEARRP